MTILWVVLAAIVVGSFFSWRQIMIRRRARAEAGEVYHRSWQSRVVFLRSPLFF